LNKIEVIFDIKINTPTYKDIGFNGDADIVGAVGKIAMRVNEVLGNIKNVEVKIKVRND